MKILQRIFYFVKNISEHFVKNILIKKCVLEICRALIVLSCILINYNNALSKEKLDSLESLLKTSISDSEKVEICNHIALIYIQMGSTVYSSKIEKFNSLAIELSKKSKIQKGFAEALLIRGKIGISARHDFGKATKDFLDAKSLFELNSDSSGVSKCYLQIGLISYLIQFYDDAINNFKYSLNYNSKTDLLTSGTANYLTALSYIELKKFDTAGLFFNNAIEVFNKTKDDQGIIQCYSYMAKMFILTNKLIEAQNCIAKVDSFTSIGSDLQTKARTLAIKSGLYLKLNNIGSAIKAGLEAHQLALEFNDELTTIEANTNLFKAYELKGDYKNAFNYLLELKTLNDSLYSANSGQRVSEIRNKYEYEKQLLIEQQQQEKQSAIVESKMQREKVIRNSILAFLIIAIVFLIFVYNQRRNLAKAKKISEELLLNILPVSVAEELKISGRVHAENYDSVSVMFTDFINFTKISSSLSAKNLVSEIDYYFSGFDKIISKYKIEKIKTIGDAYMCASGVPLANPNHAMDMVNAAFEINNFINETAEKREKENKPFFQIRCGINSGSVVAGVVGKTKFAFDIWGETVNIASRLESGGQAGKINISGNTHELIKHKFNCNYRGKIEVKNLGEIDMYFVESLNS